MTRVVAATGAAVACLCLGALASSQWLEPEPGITLSRAAQQAQTEQLNLALHASEQDQAAREPRAEPEAVFIPWAWLDEPATEPATGSARALVSETASTMRPEQAASEPAASSEQAPSTEQVAASEQPTPSEQELTEQDTYISRSEIQSVAGTDSPDATPEIAPAGAAEPPLAAAEESTDVEAPLATDVEAPPAGEGCGLITCQPGYECCNPSCGTCVAPGDNCDPTPCQSRIQSPVSFLCGRATCSVGEVCCNPSCGTCVSPGESCDQTPCDNAIQYPISVMCGRVTCSVGQECCNPSCGICVEPGETCTQQWCD